MHVRKYCMGYTEKAWLLSELKQSITAKFNLFLFFVYMR